MSFENKKITNLYKRGMRALLALLLSMAVFSSCGRPASGDASQPMQSPLPGDASQPTQSPLPGDASQPMQSSVSGDASQPIQSLVPGDASQPMQSWDPEKTAQPMQSQKPEASVPTPEPTLAPTPEPTPVPEVKLVMVGDILLHTPLAECGKSPEGGYDFSAVFANLREEIEAADVALVNQEVIIGGAELGVSGYPSFNAPYELGDALAETGFDVVLHATNHALDKRKQGILNCLSFWRENYPDMAVLGIHDSQESQQDIYVYEQQGIRIAVLNYTYGTNGVPLPEDMPYAVDMLQKDRVAADLKRAQELADFVIVCPHWGKEYVLEQTKDQENWAKLFAENGADLVLGTHPHVIEPIEQVASANGNQALVYYSLGNFVNWTSGTGAGVANRMVGGLAQVTVSLNESGDAVIKEYGVLPVVCHVEKGFGGVTVYPLSEYTEELAARNEIVKQDGSFSLQYCRELAEQVFGDAIK